MDYIFWIKADEGKSNSPYITKLKVNEEYGS